MMKRRLNNFIGNLVKVLVIKNICHKSIEKNKFKGKGKEKPKIKSNIFFINYKFDELYYPNLSKF